jgi:tetratricopeptide (TPR) repeat protein
MGLPYRPDWDRLRLALVARRDSLAMVLSERLEPYVAEELRKSSGTSGWPSTLANAQVLAGRLDAAVATERRADSARESQSPRRLTPFVLLSDTLETIRSRAWSGRMSASELAATRQRTTTFVNSQPDSLRERLRTNLVAPLGFAAANLGDTATLARLRADGIPARRTFYPGLSALAAALAGDRTDAERWLTRAAADTAFPWPGTRFTAGQAALLIGRPADALRFYQAVDDASLAVTGNIDHDWIIFARSIKGRGDASLALGDTAAARRHYERFVRLWKNADAQFHPERDAAAAALASLKRGDVPQVRVIPR